VSASGFLTPSSWLGPEVCAPQTRRKREGRFGFHAAAGSVERALGEISERRARVRPRGQPSQPGLGFRRRGRAGTHPRARRRRGRVRVRRAPERGRRRRGHARPRGGRLAQGPLGERWSAPPPAETRRARRGAILELSLDRGGAGARLQPEQFATWFRRVRRSCALDDRSVGVRGARTSSRASGSRSYYARRPWTAAVQATPSASVASVELRGRPRGRRRTHGPRARAAAGHRRRAGAPSTRRRADPNAAPATQLTQAWRPVPKPPAAANPPPRRRAARSVARSAPGTGAPGTGPRGRPPTCALRAVPRRGRTPAWVPSTVRRTGTTSSSPSSRAGRRASARARANAATGPRAAATRCCISAQRHRRSTRATRSTTSSSARATASRTPRRWALGAPGQAPTTRSSSTARVGLGKTHLLQSLCYMILERKPNARILYLSCETFVNHFISALENGDLHGVPQQVPQRRRARRRRHPAAREQGAHAGGVLPHVQHALQRRASRSCCRRTRRRRTSRRCRTAWSRASSGAWSPRSSRRATRRASRS
jgi:hypothetical protein